MARSWLGNRRSRLFSEIRGASAVCIVNTDVNYPNFRYLTGFLGGVFEGDVLIATRKRLTLITNPLEYEIAESQKPSFMTVVGRKYDPEASRRRISELIRGKRVGVDLQFLPVLLYQHLKKRYKPKRLVDASAAFAKVRLVKDEDEIAKIRRAVRITKTALREIRKYFKAGMTELELAARFDFLQMSHGASGTSFDTKVSFGKNAALPHHSPDSTRLKKGDFVLIDAGAKVDNYCSDITRTYVFGGAGSARQREILRIVRKAQKDAIAAVRPGADGKDIHMIAAKVIDSAAGGRYKGRFIHSLGHSVGLEVHDGPGFSLQSNKLKPGMVITAEPGIYIPGFGGVRIEDDILITKKGYKVL